MESETELFKGDSSPSDQRRRNTSYDPNRTTRRGRSRQLSNPAGGADDQLMGSIVRRKTVVTLPLGAQSEFWGNATGTPEHSRSRQSSHQRSRQPTPESPRMSRRSTVNPIDGILRRKQVSLDLLAPDAADFFAPPPLSGEFVPGTIEESQPFQPEDDEAKRGTEELETEAKEVKLFRPLRFAPAAISKSASVRAGRGAGTSEQEVDEEVVKCIEKQAEHNVELKNQMKALYDQLETVDSDFVEDLRRTQEALDYDIEFLQRKVLNKKVSTIPENEQEVGVLEEKEEDGDIIRATRSDYYWTAFLGVIMLAFTIVLCTWDTHLDESALIRLPVGYACATPCDHQAFFEEGHNTFKTNEVIELLMHLDPHHNGTEAHPIVHIVGIESGHSKKTVDFPPPDKDIRLSIKEQVNVNFEDPEEEHALYVYSSDNVTLLTFTLHTETLTPLANYSVLIAAILLVSVYALILLEVIHRTLVAIYGSIVALFFLFVIRGGQTLSITSIMLLMEWSTLGLLFGMMIIVGEMSHTGVFEWFAVRVLVLSKGSFRRLLVMLCTLTAIASAFLDNVTTMLLLAPVTIDMCKILGVDPRPYLISEVILSNIGGTATLIGDPPNIIIGTSIESIDFVDFIINVAPCVFFFLIPVALILILVEYNYFFTAFKMKELDAKELKKAYPIYDEPRLLISGVVASFVILSFFLHPLHHADTAWVAIIGALLAITFTNPHDVQDALRNHVEWDTLLFFAGLFVLVEVCAELGLLEAIGDVLGDYIAQQPEGSQLSIAITVIIWVSAIASAFVDNIPWTTTMIPIIQILAEEIPTLPIETLAWALCFGACLGGNGTLLGASANIVTAGISTNKGYNISFLNFLYPGFTVMIATVAIAHLYMLIVYVWI